jgi:hypothetical protein
LVAQLPCGLEAQRPNVLVKVSQDIRRQGLERLFLQLWQKLQHAKEIIKPFQGCWQFFALDILVVDHDRLQTLLELHRILMEGLASALLLALEVLLHLGQLAAFPQGLIDRIRLHVDQKVMSVPFVLRIADFVPLLEGRHQSEIVHDRLLHFGEEVLKVGVCHFNRVVRKLKYQVSETLEAMKI